MDWDPGSARFSGLNTPSTMAAANQPFMPNLSSPGWEAGNLMKTQRVVTVMDRQLLISDDGEPASLYTLCRKWVQNDPELETQSIPEPPTLSLPPPPAPDPTPAPPAPTYPEDSETCEAEESLRRLKDHWVSVRQHHQAVARSRTERHRHRLTNLLQGIQAPPLPLQQQQAPAVAAAAAGPADPAASAAPLMPLMQHGASGMLQLQAAQAATGQGGGPAGTGGLLMGPGMAQAPTGPAGAGLFVPPNYNFAQQQL